MQYKNGNSYSGYWLNGDHHGPGTLTLKSITGSDEVYSGSFEKGVKHGFGIIEY